jgi:hypothetical protein
MTIMQGKEAMTHQPIGPNEEEEFYDADLEADIEDEEEDDEELVERSADDFSDLDDILAEATRETEEDKRLKAARKRLSHILKHDHATKEDEKLQLLAEIRKLEENRVWLTIGVVALFHTQECATCGNKHAFFHGWMTEQKHLSDPNARRLLAGRPVQKLAERREDHFQGMIDCCSNCVECVIAINAATGEKE